MTSDAKIGLLLGLVFIFIIAFIINGLPSLRASDNHNELMTNMVSCQSSTPGFTGAKAQQTRQIIYPPRSPQTQIVNTSLQAPAQQTEVRFRTPLPNNPVASAAEQTLGIEPPAAAAPQQTTTEKPAPTVKSPTTYVVQNGDSLAAIAKKFYGADEGNRKVNIDKIYQANKATLKTPDQISVGQKLTIPVLNATSTGSASVLSSSILETVKSIGRRHFSSDTKKTKSSVRVHTVRSNDNLWKIAAKYLGDGNRYREIRKLNSSVLKNENSLVVGMKLKIPPK